jgi:shikimate dehydrogenase
MKYGLIGEKLGHSYSKIIHEKLAAYTYDLVPLNRKEFVSFMEAKDFLGINVTIPYKQEVIPYLDELDPLAKKIGAVNTVINRAGKLFGYNTDFYGFEYMILHNHILVEGKEVLVLGNGGAAQAVIAVLNHLGAAKVWIVSRRNSEHTISYEACIKDHTNAEIIVNTTPLGMYPKIDATPLDLSSFTGCKAVLDIIYNPARTKLTLQAASLGIKGLTGLEMLVAQAKKASEYFLDTTFHDSVIDQITLELLKEING